ncbi:heavy metal translocating P-type ATPase [Candidatus Methanoperedens nitratireducens]|uniref:Putative cadmium-transporting ATPase n=1 Tax=Candidatus Methanoperedens nitratireducens TaxID=1392998 RepID=A0A284VLU5_9EURY|nr:cation-translocating P-type ATPase [Candidatus Methanoperedens nitroreducens]SNQ60183.1 putative cadmium-transporting ATPase [Candidatus Methanoperedens nitroreducens]
MVELKDIELEIRGMDCPSCAKNVENAVRKLNGIGEINVDFIIGKAAIKYDPSLTNTSEIREAIEKAGYAALEDGKDDYEVICSSCSTDIFEEKLPLWKQRNIRIIALSSVLLVLGLSMEYVTGSTALSHILFLFAGVISGYSIAKKGISSLLKKRLDMNFLMTIAAVGAFSIGYGEEGASVLYLFFIAEFLEGYASERARKSIGSLVKLAPDTAIVIRDGKEVNVHVHDANINDITVVRPGEKIPLDGIVISGESSVNQAAITGESMPVHKEIGDPVYAGTLNEHGYLEIRVSKMSEDTVLSKIVRLVEEAERKKSTTEKFVDKFARYYTPVVIFLAVGVATVPNLVFGKPFDEWLYKALVLLVISCPCALAISTPVSMVSGITGAAKNGVLIKGGNYMEEMAKAKVFVFDKTGTLTEGRPVVTDTIEVNNYSSGEILETAASIEALSEHPLAKAIVSKARNDRGSLKPVSGFKATPGKGVKGVIDRSTYCIGSPAMFSELSIPFPDEKVRELESDGKTAILIGNKECMGIIAIMDKVRDAAPETISMLKKKGMRVVMLTGDNERIARSIASQLGIDEYRAGLLPEDKVRIVEELDRKYGKVVMVGDGVNDAPALAVATVGIAMGAIGSDVALETADIALMHDDISKLPYLFELSKKTFGIIKENIFSSIMVKGSFAVLAFPGIVTLWMAVAFGDMGLSLLVIVNAMRLAVLKPGHF